MKAPLPKDEDQRLAVLRAYGLLDTEPEQDFDEMAALASSICDCPIAILTLVDRARQWFKASVGLEVRETDRDVAFCAHAILTPDLVMVVPDARKDGRFADNPLVIGDPGIRFYAGVPLKGTGGAALGTMCVIDRRPRELTGEQMSALTVIAHQVTRLMELRRISADLARALRDVKVLEGLLPTCCHCKAIRDERGEWHPMELYVMERTRTAFTHGICPDCAKARYPDLDLTQAADGQS